MNWTRLTAANVAFLFLFGTAVSANHVKEGTKLDHHDDGENSNRRVYLPDGKIDTSEGIINKIEFEEDEKLWERILQRDLSLTSPPTFPPTFPPTPAPVAPVTTSMPTNLPIMAEDEECELMVTVACVEVEGNGRIPCAQVPKPSDEVECVRDVEYVYNVANSCDPSLNPNCDDVTLRTFAIVRNGNLKNLLPLVPENTRVAPAENIFIVESNLEFDFCQNQTVDTSVRLIGDTAPGMQVGICSAEASNFFSVGFVPDLPCKVAVDLSCFVENGDERINCKDIPMPEDDEDCLKEVVFATIVTNVGDVDKTILALDRTRDGEAADLLPLLNQRDLAPGEFAVAREEGQVIDFCVQRLVTTTIDVESEAFGVGQLECFEQTTLVFSIAITCMVDVKAECFADASSGFSVPCSDFNPFASESFMVGCEHVHKYVYTIENTGPGDEVIEGITVTRYGFSTNILDRRFNLEPDEIREVNEFQVVDYCQDDYPNGITTLVEVTADMVPIGGSCFDNDEITVFPLMEPCNVLLDPFIKCTVEAPDGSEVLCSVYHEQIKDLDDPEQCLREVEFEYTLVNEGIACLLVYSVTAEIDNEGSFDLTPAMGKTLCPKEVLILKQTQVEDFCDEDLEDRVVVIVNEGPPETCGGFGALGFFPPEEEKECLIELELGCSTTAGGDCIVVSSQELTLTKCDFHPCYIDLTFTGGKCSLSRNSQDYGFECHDIGDVTSLSSAYVTVHSFEGIEYFADTVQLADTLRIGDAYKKLSEGVIVKTHDGEGGTLMQKFKFLTTCYKPLYTNDIFGAFTVAGFGDKKNAVTAVASLSEGTGADFEFTYNIANIGEADAFLKEIVFTTAGTQLASINLSGTTVEIGRTYTDSESISLPYISASAEVSAVVVARSPADFECTATDEVTIDYQRIDNVLVQVQCLDCPTSFLFKFNGGKCDQSMNSQDIQCTDKALIPSSARILITDSNFKHIFFEQEVDNGDVFEISAGLSSFKTDIIVKIINHYDVVQIIKFHASCSEPIYLGDVFGSIQIVGWTNHKQGAVKL